MKALTVFVVLVAVILPFGKVIAEEDCCGYLSPGNQYECCSNGNCTWWAWRMRPDLPDSWGNAATWLNSAVQTDIPTGDEPVGGAIACFWGTEWPPEGHVAFVESVNPDGSFYVSEMGCDSWNCLHNSTYEVSEAQGFIYGGPAGNGPTYEASWSSQTPLYPPGMDYYPVAPGQIVLKSNFQSSIPKSQTNPKSQIPMFQTLDIKHCFGFIKSWTLVIAHIYLYICSTINL